MTLAEAFDRVVAALDAADVGYALAGGLAVGLYTQPRATEDIDIAVLRVPDSGGSRGGAGLVAAALRAVFSSVYVNSQPMDFGAVRVSRLLVIDGEDSFVVDVLDIIDDEFRDSVARRVRRLPGAGVVISPEDLLVLKSLSDRPRDRLDRDAIRGAPANLDEAYVERWVNRLGPPSAGDSAAGRH